MTCPYATSGEPLNTSRYLRLHQDGRELIQSWFRRACNMAESDEERPFEPFIFAWFSFNGWAACVSGEDTDRKMVCRVADCPDLRRAFDEVFEANSQFRASVEQFAEMWPIFKAQDLRNHDHYCTPENRPEVIQEYLQEGITHAPECIQDHWDQNEPVPKDWPHTLHTIYRVRCNLFHGEKSAHSDIDAKIVRLSFNVLVSFLKSHNMIVS